MHNYYLTYDLLRRYLRGEGVGGEAPQPQPAKLPRLTPEYRNRQEMLSNYVMLISVIILLFSFVQM